jgi:hypothetical protein
LGGIPESEGELAVALEFASEPFCVRLGSHPENTDHAILEVEAFHANLEQELASPERLLWLFRLNDVSRHTHCWMIHVDEGNMVSVKSNPR